jgi:hypothetical protein
VALIDQERRRRTREDAALTCQVSDALYASPDPVAA